MTSHATPYREEFIALFLIATGGFAGSVLHFWINGICATLPGTLLVNTLGSFLLGLFMYETTIGRFGRRSRMFFGVGFLGAFTTFSGLALIAVQEPPVTAALYLAVTLVLGLCAVFAGRTIVYRIHRGA
jgi:fluoride exporter